MARKMLPATTKETKEYNKSSCAASVLIHDRGVDDDAKACPPWITSSSDDVFSFHQSAAIFNVNLVS